MTDMLWGVFAEEGGKIYRFALPTDLNKDEILCLVHVNCNLVRRTEPQVMTGDEYQHEYKICGSLSESLKFTKRLNDSWTSMIRNKDVIQKRPYFIEGHYYAAWECSECLSR